MKLVRFSTMELLVLTLCLLGVVSSLPLEVEQLLVQGDDVQAQLNDDLPIEQDQTLSQKENVRVLRQYETMLIPRTSLETAGSSEDCIPYYGRTHPVSMPILSGLSSFTNILPEAHATSYTTSTSAGIRRGPYLNQGGIITLASPIGSFSQPHETQLAEQHQAHSFFTTVPYISGYRMSPIYSQKQIVVKDYSHPEYQTHSAIPVPSGPGTAINPQAQYTARSIDHLMSTDDSMLSKTMDFNTMFGQPLYSAEGSASKLRSAEDYDKAMEDLRQRLEHLESLRQNIATIDDSSEPQENVNYV